METAENKLDGRAAFARAEGVLKELLRLGQLYLEF